MTITRYPTRLIWFPFPFNTNIGDYAGGFQPCQYGKDGEGIVHLRGLCAKFLAPANPQTLGTLPSGFRPAMTELFAQIGSYAGGNMPFRVDVNSAGLVQVNTTSGIAWDSAFMSLAGITFPQAG